MKKTIIKEYADLIVKLGANVQKGQDVIINIDIDQELLASYLVKSCYDAKARNVTINWNSDKISKIKFKKASINSLKLVPDWYLNREQYYVDTLPALIYIESSDPDAMKGINHEKIAKVNMAIYPKIKPYKDARDNKQQWVIAGAPSKAWAKKVFPKDKVSVAVEKLWNAILETSRATGDPIENWKKHNKELHDHCNKLNQMNLESLHYTSSNGTDLVVKLIKNVNFLGGEEKTISGVHYNPNIPSEECFTSPDRNGTNGIVYSTKPLSYQGQIIEDFHIVFKDGKAIEVHAKKNQALLEQMIKMDASAAYLGEAALVPFDSPINNTNILFLSTLYDENACCHLALGTGFPETMVDFDKYSLEDITKKGINNSMIHVDFMIGSEDLHIVGHTRDNKDIVIFDHGNWAF